MLNRRYKKLKRIIEKKKKDSLEKYKYYKNRDDDKTASRYLIIYATLKSVLTLDEGR